jgi:hypothetical protein
MPMPNLVPHSVLQQAAMQIRVLQGPTVHTDPVTLTVLSKCPSLPCLPLGRVRVTHLVLGDDQVIIGR